MATAAQFSTFLIAAVSWVQGSVASGQVSWTAHGEGMDMARMILAETHRQPMQQYLREHRRALHQIPEIQYKEHRTSAYIRAQLDEMNITYQYPVAETGIIAKIGRGAGPVIGLRADMDALPVREPLNLSAGSGGWRSQHEDMMHACGHDVHMAMLLEAARILKAHELLLQGTVLLVFQPAEEGGGGAKRILASGALANVSALAGLHVWPTLPSGTITTRAGVIMAASDRFEIHVQGKGAHGAMPHLGTDPIVAASALVLALQPLVSRETSPLDGAVVTVGTFNSGVGACNIIADAVDIQGTIRALKADTMARVRRRVEEVAVGTAATYGCNATVRWGVVPYLPVVNDPHMTDLVSTVAAQLTEAAANMPANSAEDAISTTSQLPNETCSATDLDGTCSGPEQTDEVAPPAPSKGSSTDKNRSGIVEVVTKPFVTWQLLEEPSMAAEDFSFYANEIPSVFTFLGVGNAALGTNVGLHNSRFQMDESVMALGTALHVAVTLNYLAAHVAAAGTESS